jgi:hypothetical protein
MAICGSCGKEIRDDVWTCGFCGAPVVRRGSEPAADDSAYGSEGYNPYANAGSGTASGGYGTATTSYGDAPEGLTPYGTPLPQAAPPSSGGLSSTTKLVLVGAGVAVVAIVLVWFLAIRGSQIGGDQFVGHWTAVDAKAGSMAIAKDEGHIEITLVSPQGAKAGPFKGDLQGDRLELTFEAANGDDTNKAIAGVLKAYLSGALDDGHLLLTVRDTDGHLVMSISGKAPSGEDVNAQAAEYVKATSSI